MSFAPKEQLRPTEKIGIVLKDAKKASSVWPESVRPPLSATVTLSMIGTFRPTVSIAV